MTQVISVSRLNLYAKSLLEGDSNLSDVAVEGELSNYKRYPSGHAYFSLKDKNSQVKGVMFASYFRNLNFVPENGMKVILRGKVSLYERDGTFQINATNRFLSGQRQY
jgi:exodeoxyribonuclease VII large subunit